MIIFYWLWLRTTKSMGGNSEKLSKPLFLQRYGPMKFNGEALFMYQIEIKNNMNKWTININQKLYYI